MGMARNEMALACAWQELHAIGATLASVPLLRLFDDPARFDGFSLEAEGLLFDYSKCKLDRAAVQMLLELAVAAGIPEQRDSMFAGEKINRTEDRAVLHAALRATNGARFFINDRNVVPDILETRARCFAFAEGIREGAVLGATGARFTDVINLGIGGSDLGPAMAAEALKPYRDGPRLHFVSNVDGAHLADTLAGLDPAQTLVLIASKTFTTIETMTNARSARSWVVARLGEAAVAQHFAAISTALDKVKAFGIDQDRAFGFWDWVGGRYSIWSSIGLPLMLGIGSKGFEAFLAGGASIDHHFRSQPLERNIPVLMGLVGIWHRNICGHASRAIIPYAQRLHRFPAYLQQLDMESNGKRVSRDGLPLSRASGPLVWGEPGTNGQHAFFQLIHQGTDVIPVEFLIGAKGEDDPALAAHHPLLVANCLAQSQALMRGRTLEEAAGNPHRVFEGDRPSTTLIFPALTPFVLGQLIALYEHRVFVEAAIWNINAFDQWGVELGKELATKLEGPVKTGAGLEALDSSTAGLVLRVRRQD
jgi:glucose-6-phosphate isomerase